MRKLLNFNVKTAIELNKILMKLHRVFHYLRKVFNRSRGNYLQCICILKYRDYFHLPILSNSYLLHLIFNGYLMSSIWIWSNW